MWTLSLGVVGGSLINLGLVFPLESRLVYNHPYLRWGGLFFGVDFGVYNFSEFI
ncbi:MAG: hypothetical protein UZ14_CFX002000368 [Chloroflexi bacterium OLB14]|nr:MAG: hypothetical protein UZ14_CFX002000368 [Chloroflexi bacterium OLB14]